MTKVDLELISDADMYIFLEKGTRRGVSYISNIYSKGNNKCLNSYYPKQESKHVIYLGYFFGYLFCQQNKTMKFCSFHMFLFYDLYFEFYLMNVLYIH